MKSSGSNGQQTL